MNGRLKLWSPFAFKVDIEVGDGGFPKADIVLGEPR